MPQWLKYGRIAGILGAARGFDKENPPPCERALPLDRIRVPRYRSGLRTPPPQTMPYRPIPPMQQDEYRAVVRSLVGKFIGSILTAGLFFFLSLHDYLRLDAVSCATLGFFLFFCAGGKLFPESSKFISRRARNYRRAKKGLEPLDVDDEPTAEIVTNFQRKT